MVIAPKVSTIGFKRSKLMARYILERNTMIGDIINLQFVFFWFISVFNEDDFIQYQIIDYESSSNYWLGSSKDE